jgi:PAS domain S-box-containing protein
MQNTYIQVIKRLDIFATSFSKIGSLEEMVQSIEGILEDIFIVEYTGLYLYDPSENLLRLLYAKGFNEAERKLAEKSAMERHPGIVYRTKKMIYIPDTLLDTNDLTMSSERSFVVRSRLFLPVMNGDQVVGAFGIVDPKPNAYNEEDIAILSFICNMAGALYGNILNINLIKSANKEIENLSRFTSETINPVMRISKDRILLYANSNDASAEILKTHNLKIGGLVTGEFLEGFNESLKIEKSVIREIKAGKKLYSIMFIPVENAGYINLHGREITDQKNLENELKKMALIAKETGNTVIITNKTGKIEWVNDAFTKMTEYTLDEVKGKTPGDFLQGDETDPKSIALLSDAIKNYNPLEVDLINYSKSGKKYWVKLQIQPVFNSNGQLENFISVQKEITKEKETEHELIKTTDFQKAILNSSAIAIISTDLNGIIQSFNLAASRMLGYSDEEVIGVSTPLLFHDPEEIDFRTLYNPNQSLCYFGHCNIQNNKDLQNTSIESNEYTCIRKDGSKFSISLTVSPLRGEYGEVTGFLGMAEDITERKEQQDALQITNLRFRSLISSLQAGVMVEDEQRKVVLVNQRFCDLFALPVSPEQLIGGNCEDAAEAVKELFKNPETFIQDINNTLTIKQINTNHELIMKDGTSLERDFIPIEDREKKNFGILWIYRDISQKKHNERDLLRQSQILSGTAQAMNYLLTLPDHNQAIQKALETIGIAAGVDRVYIFENDESTGESFFSQRFEWTAKGIVPQIDNQELQKMPYSSNFPRWYNLLSAGKTVSGLSKDFPENERKILESEDIISIIAAPIFVNDQLWGMVGFDDCSIGIEWSTNELSILQALAGSLGGSISKRIIENEITNARHIAEYATKSKSEFLATMSHEIRTPMNGIIGMTSLLMQTPLTFDQRDYAETIKTSGELLLNLINDILDFSKIESGKMTLEEHSFNLKMAIEDVLDLMSTAAFEKRIGLFFQVDPVIPQKITGDLTRLRQILVNLTGNALKFTTYGEVVINVRQIELQGDEAILEFSIKDTGIGIPEEKIDRLFKPFSQVDASTTRKYGGTGLGLAICSKLVKLMNGDIRAKSKLNHGSEFIFTIKTIYQRNDEQISISFPHPKVLKDKAILIIDGNQTSREILNSLFKDLEMNVLSVDSAKVALNIINERKDVELILIDGDLPDMDSSLLASEIKKNKEYVDRPLILMTYPSLTELGSTIDRNFIVRINKPLKHSQLISYVSDLFSGNRIKEAHNTNQPKQPLKINDLYPLKILVAEDNAINQKLISKLFEMLGYSIQIAANGYEVIDAINRMSFDIVFMDIQMPEMDGIEATQQIIARWGDDRPLIVAMTANALKTDKEKCLATGMDDYISKPLTINQVRSGIEKWALMRHII